MQENNRSDSSSHSSENEDAYVVEQQQTSKNQIFKKSDQTSCSLLSSKVWSDAQTQYARLSYIQKMYTRKHENAKNGNPMPNFVGIDKSKTIFQYDKDPTASERANLLKK